MKRGKAPKQYRIQVKECGRWKTVEYHHSQEAAETAYEIRYGLGAVRVVHGNLVLRKREIDNEDEYFKLWESARRI